MAVRDEKGLPETTKPIGGVSIRRNPGVVALVTASQFTVFRSPTGPLIRIEEPFTATWWAHGRAATRDEVLESITTGLPILREEAAKDGPEALAELDFLYERAAVHFPQEHP